MFKTFLFVFLSWFLFTRNIRIKPIIFVCLLSPILSFSQTVSSAVITGAEQMKDYLPLLKNKKVSLMVNQTSMVKQTHLVDTLLSVGVQITGIFAPEHGFRGTGDAGEKILSGVDAKTGLRVTSMYGASKKPSAKSMEGMDIVVYDIQDVGVRFYTYISSLQYMMEACVENNLPLLILDRPNPNGFYVDGPVLESAYQSFIGMQSIPIVYGMTVGEYAQMLNGEMWLSGKKSCLLTVISCKNYEHKTLYELPVAPSPNLRTAVSILLYPSLCLFEGTDVSVGRGTSTPFEVWGHPAFKTMSYSFTPVSTPGAKTPPHKDEVCYGENLSLPAVSICKLVDGKLNLFWIQKAYSLSENKDSFFTPFFLKLSGTASLKKQLQDGWSEQQIRKSWQPRLETFKQIRRKYLLYTDFE